MTRTDIYRFLTACILFGCFAYVFALLMVAR